MTGSVIFKDISSSDGNLVARRIIQADDEVFVTDDQLRLADEGKLDHMRWDGSTQVVTYAGTSKSVQYRVNPEGILDPVHGYGYQAVKIPA